MSILFIESETDEYLLGYKIDLQLTNEQYEKYKQYSSEKRFKSLIRFWDEKTYAGFSNLVQYGALSK